MRGPGMLAICLCACGVELDNPGPIGSTLWSPPQRVEGASSARDEDDPTLSSSALELFFSYEDPDDGDNKHLYYMSRPSRSAAWSTPSALSFNERGSVDQTPRLSDDDLTLYFASNRDPMTNGLDIWRVSRPSAAGAWGTPQTIPELVDPDDDDKWFAPCAGGRYLMISQRGPGNNDAVYEGVLGGAPPAAVPELSSMRGETGTFLAGDCMTIHFASQRSGDNRIYRARRDAPDGRWSEPVLVDDFAMLGGDQEDPWLARDGRTFVFVSDVAGSKDVYLSTR